jgi:hypothetical protein
MKKITNCIFLFLFVLIGMNFSLQAQIGNYTDDVYGLFANKDSRVVTTIKEVEGSDEVIVEAILVGWLHVGTFQITLKYDPTVVAPVRNDGTEITTPLIASGTGGLASELATFLWLNPALKNSINWWDVATGEVHPEPGAYWMHILLGGNEYQHTNDTLQTGKIRQIFRVNFKKLPGKSLSNTTFTYYEKLTFPPARNQFNRGSYLYMSEDLPDLINIYEDVEVFSRRIPSSVETDAPEIHGVNVILKGLADSRGLTKIPAKMDSPKSGGLDWDTITSTGFIYSKNNVALRIDEYSEQLWVGATPYPFPTAMEISSGTFTRGTYTFSISTTPNTNRDTYVNMTKTLNGLDRGDTYYAYAYMQYKFQTSNEYPAMGAQFQFIPGCSVPIVAATNDGDLCTGANVMLYVENTADYVNVTYKWYRGTTEVIGETNSYLITNMAGDYYVEAIMSSCTERSDAKTVTGTSGGFTYPQPVVAASNDGELCTGATMLLYLDNIAQLPGATYQWYFEGLPVTGETNSYLRVNTNGHYHIEVIIGSCSMVSATYTVSLSGNGFTYPLPIIAATNDGIVCTGANVMLYIVNVDDYEDIEDVSYQWYYQGIPMDEETNPYLLTVVAGFYHVEVIIGNCSAVTEDKRVTIGGTFGADQPEIAVTHDGVLCDTREVTLSVANADVYPTSATYQWHRNGALIPNADQEMYVTYDTGYYHVEVIIGSCSRLSEEFHVTYKPICGVIVAGTVFPFVNYPGDETFNNLFAITVSLKEIPDTPATFDLYDLITATPVYETTAVYYDGSFFVPNSPYNPGVLGRMDNYGSPIDFLGAIGVEQQPSPSAILEKNQAPVPANMTLGLYKFDEVEEGDYILEIKREGFVIRWAKIEVGEDTLYLEHREIIPGDINQDLNISNDDMSDLIFNINATYDDQNPAAYLNAVKYDLDADGQVINDDVNLLIIYMGFGFNHYIDTKTSLAEIGINY